MNFGASSRSFLAGSGGRVHRRSIITYFSSAAKHFYLSRGGLVMRSLLAALLIFSAARPYSPLSGGIGKFYLGPSAPCRTGGIAVNDREERPQRSSQKSKQPNRG